MQLNVFKRLALVLAASSIVFASCGGPGAARYERKRAQDSLSKLENPGLVLGEFRITKVTDGDTIRVDGLDSSMRLLGMDTEETFKKEVDRRDAEADFAAYLVDRRGKSKHPVKIASPLGELAKQWGKEFFAGVEIVKLERDDATEIRDRYDRYLAYVFKRAPDGTWINYNVEAVRAGMSPYFTKYGQSKRFHAEFVAAEKEARAARRGIWDPTLMHAVDYDERKLWWDARGEFIAAFDRASVGKPDHLVVTRWDLQRQLELRVGKQVTLLGTVGDIRLGDRGPTRVMLSRRPGSDFPLIFFDKDVLTSSGLREWRGEFVTVTGVLSEYTNKYNGKKQIQILVESPSQITLSPIPGLTMPTDIPTPTPTTTSPTASGVTP